ncbi:MAG: molybdopterin-binding protein, partial [Syntrophorhabdaceae bacterium]|nr:molybdopterin-binding protein [Syntrophorhabdaceae bacterium]
MKRYLDTLKIDDAINKVLNFVTTIEDEELVPSYRSVGRITTRALYATKSSPPYMCSAMDGYAVSFELTLEADINKPVSISKEDAFYVNTGDPLPTGTNAVIIIEDVEESESSITIRRPVHLWQNVRMIGEDIIETDMVVPKNHKIRPYDMGIIISSGIQEVHVRRNPRMLIIPTGKELIDIFEDDSQGYKGYGLIDFNSYTLKGIGEELGFEVEKFKIIRDKEELKNILNNLVEKFDVILINAGTSSGTEDFTGHVIRELGQVVFHGVSMMPGKPTLFGIIRGKPVFGIPGYPVSAVLSFRAFLIPLYEKMCGIKIFVDTIHVRVPYKIPSKIGTEEIVRVSIIEKNGIDYAVPLPRGASIFSSMVKADGLIKIPENIEGYDEDATVECTLLVERGYLKNRINLIGSHDLILDVIRDMIKKRHSGLDFISTHTGSLSGMMAFKKGIVDLCTTHILDEEKRVYNIPIIKRYLEGLPCVLIHLVKRTQGILVKKGNPKKINTI